MAISPEVRELVRQLADYRCEYCGVSEIDTGGELTIDHFCPTTHGGTDEPANLLYCCMKCNQYKADFWPDAEDIAAGRQLLHPRQENLAIHLIQAADDTLRGLTSRGQFHIERLRLNRPQLVAYRQQKRLNWIVYRQTNRLKEVLRSCYDELSTTLTQSNQQESLRIQLKAAQLAVLRLLLELKGSS
jgi:hypothetical protein